MTIISKLASSLGRRDETPNIQLAESIVKQKDKAAVKELTELLSGKNKDLQSDAIKVLYETGERAPELIAPYTRVFVALLGNKQNRLVWGAMTALDCIAAVEPGTVYSNLGIILAAADKGSVISRDHAVGILVKLAADKQYKDEALILLKAQLQSCAINQLPMYAEKALPLITGDYKKMYSDILLNRIHEIDKESKQKRIEKVLKKLT